MISGLNSIRAKGSALALFAFLLGMISAWLWLGSDAKWSAHLTRAYHVGRELYVALSADAPMPESVQVTTLSAAEQTKADRGAFAQIEGVPHPAFVTFASVLETSTPERSGRVLHVAFVSPDLTYPLADVSGSSGEGAADTLGKLTRVLASYCSDPIVFARWDEGPWLKLREPDVWDCHAAPQDRRLLAAVLAIVGAGIIFTVLMDTSSAFTRFADLLRNRRRLGGPERYETDGPDELKDIVDAVNSHLRTARDQLEKRALVLSGVSHDLGTPATRLRLRAALIDDPELRGKLEADIDQMTGIIESVLTYTRVEVNSEKPRELSLTSLVEALVADYSDTGKPVELREADEEPVLGGGSVFMSRRGQSSLPDQRRIIVTARPISLQRALSNLIDNALKYGRRATVELEADADTATITVEDEGVEYGPEDLERLTAPYLRGKNTHFTPGFGLGLTIVASIANMHGGALAFEKGARGIRARFTLQRR
jgi:signal transduction histidine kinase